ncbi:hypothetical protein HW555_011586 [Spodoptera exigua]|uniref:Mitochondrial import inner membrane translocase subunit n=2 Tax=Spodoptera exigua TaxID=7107 RepID=A0A835L4G7_SPOEX|nr:hypothetical protein HW555_011586 [Spodoptera exigua]
MAVTVTSLSLFVVAKNSINARRLENMRARERMRKSNEGEYPDLYRRLEESEMASPMLDPAKLQLVQELEIEMMSDMYNRLVTACHRKCIPVKYQETELCKGESVCLDRCVAKYLDVHERIGKKLSNMSQGEGEDLTKVNMDTKK